jgi:hypothetical protein
VHHAYPPPAAPTRASSGEGALPITVFLDAVAQIAEVYDMLFSVQMIANQLKGDINNSIDVCVFNWHARRRRATRAPPPPPLSLTPPLVPA